MTRIQPDPVAALTRADHARMHRQAAQRAQHLQRLHEHHAAREAAKRDAQRLTAAQFEALAELAREAATPSRAAARLVLVDGWRPSDAALAQDVTRAAVTNAVRRTLARLDLCRAAAGVS